jgi:hypothetical protein
VKAGPGTLAEPALTPEEAEALRPQTATSKKGRGGRRYLPVVFTEQRVAMLSSVLRSPRAAHRLQKGRGVKRTLVTEELRA